MKEDKVRYTHMMTVKELAAALEFAQNIEASSVNLVFSPTSLGNHITVVEKVVEPKMPYLSVDITDYDSW